MHPSVMNSLCRAIRSRRFRVRSRFLITALVLLTALACHDSKSAATDYASPDLSEAPEQLSVQPELGITHEARTSTGSAAGSTDTEGLRHQSPHEDLSLPMLIKRGELHFRVVDLEDARTRLSLLLKQHEAYLSSEDGYGRGAGERRFSIRVPANRFDELIETLLPLAEEELFRSVSVRDVSEEYIDIEARLRTQRALQERLLTLLSRASKVEDVIRVEHELARVIGVIEQAEARLKYLRDRSTYSELSLRFSVEEPEAAQANFFADLLERLGEGFRGLQVALLALAAIWPLWTALSIGLLAYRIFKNRRKVEAVA